MDRGIPWFEIFGLTVCFAAVIYILIQSKNDMKTAQIDTSEDEWTHPHLAPLKNLYNKMYRFYEVTSKNLSEQIFVLEDEVRNKIGNFNRHNYTKECKIDGRSLKVKIFRRNQIVSGTGERANSRTIIFSDDVGILYRIRVINRNNERGYKIDWRGREYILVWPRTSLLRDNWPAKFYADGQEIGLITRRDAEKVFADLSNKTLIVTAAEVPNEVLIILGILCVVDFFPRRRLLDLLLDSK